MFFRRAKEPVAWIIVFLGNPGIKYENTRHNVGFMTADYIASKMNFDINRVKFKALTAKVNFGGEDVLFMKPQTYMNLSGDAIRGAIRFYKLPQRNIVVVSDEISLPPGKMRIRREGSAGGHNGLRDIINKCGGSDFPRVRIGVGSPPNDDYELIDWVLSKPDEKDTLLINETIQKAAQALEMIVAGNIDKAMSTYN